MKRTPNSSKSRNGCHRCKSKHIKCDETKPDCRICQAQGAQCPGYVKELKWSNKHEVHSSGPQPPRKRQRTVHPSPTSPSVSNETSLSPGNESTGGRVNSLVAAPQLGLQPSDDIDLFEWPSLEQYGYEDLAFSSALYQPTTETSFETAFSYPFLGDLSEIAHQESEPPQTTGTESIITSDEGEELSSPDVPSNLEKTQSGSAGLLQTFYRLTVPSKVPGFSDQDLVHHYFKHVCPLYSCFDSEQNPFRTLVASTWADSKTISTAIQSLAVGHLANHYPHMASQALAKRSMAWKSLQKDLQLLRSNKCSADTVLLSLLLLGLSSVWHQASNLGLQYLFIARDLVQTKLKNNDQSPLNDFFMDAVIHWEMLASLVDPVPMSPFSGLKSPTLHLPMKPRPIKPHPWTGLLNHLAFLFGEIGRVLRRRQRDGLISTDDEEWVGILSQALTSLVVPEAADVVDFDDPCTASTDLVAIAKAYRCIAFLELYQSYPRLLWDALSEDKLIEDFQQLKLSQQSRNEEELHLNLTSIATHTLQIVKPIPISSAACRLLPLIMLSAGSQVRIPDDVKLDTDQSAELLDVRYLVEQRMLVLSRKYPQRPLLVMTSILKEVWERVDAGLSGAHWMDVAHEKCWQTIMG